MARRSGSSSAKASSDGEVSAGTHRGRRRGHNEDAVIVERLPSGDLLLAVADGMGGAQAGEVASSEAVRELVDRLRSAPLDAPPVTLRKTVEGVNLYLYELSNTKEELHGMGTTMVAALIRGNQVWVANVGDSRASVARGGALQQVTRDHSLVADQVRAGYLTEEEARDSNQRNVITRSLGAQNAVEVDIFGPLRLNGTHRLILCSDGLHGVLADEAVFDIVSSSSPKQAVSRLIDVANKRGGPDNISAIVYQPAPGADDTILVRLPPQLALRRGVLVAAAAAAAILLALLVVLVARAGGFGMSGGGGEDKGGAAIGVPLVTATATSTSVAPSATPARVSPCQASYTLREGDSFSALRPLIEGACGLAPFELARLNLEPDTLAGCRQFLAGAASWEELDLRSREEDRVRSALQACLPAGDVLVLRKPSRPGATLATVTATLRAQPVERTATAAATATATVERPVATPIRGSATPVATKAAG